MLRQTFATALVLSAMLPALAQGQEAMSPPPPGPYQAMNMTMPAMPTMPGSVAMPEAAQMPEPVAPSAAQIWGRPAMLQLPYWMQAPGPAIHQQDRRQGAVSDDARPEPQGGGQATTRQISPAGQPTAPTSAAPGYGVGLTPGFFPGYSARQDGAAQLQMGGGATSRGEAGNRGQYGYGYGAGQPYPSYPLQMPVPYWNGPFWAMPMAPAYPYPPQANRWEQR